MLYYLVIAVFVALYASHIIDGADLPEDFPINPNNFIWKKPENFSEPELDSLPIDGYHFHTYFFQNNSQSKQQAMNFRHQIQAQINSGELVGCRLNIMWYRPQGPHPIGNFETCCNASSLATATQWFMKNHGHHSVLLHPLTRYALDDHNSRAMWLGSALPLDLTALPWDQSETLRCDALQLPLEEYLNDEL